MLSHTHSHTLEAALGQSCCDHSNQNLGTPMAATLVLPDETEASKQPGGGREEIHSPGLPDDPSSKLGQLSQVKEPYQPHRQAKISASKWDRPRVAASAGQPRSTGLDTGAAGQTDACCLGPSRAQGGQRAISACSLQNQDVLFTPPMQVVHLPFVSHFSFFCTTK